MYQSDNDFCLKMKDFKVDLRHRTVSDGMKSTHSHETYEIYYLLSGDRYFFIKDRTYHVTKGDIVIINQYELHRAISSSTPNHDRILITLKKDFLKFINNNFQEFDLFSCFTKGINVLRLDINEQSHIEALFYKIIKEARNRTEYSDIYLRLLTAELMILINRNIGSVSNDVLEYPSPLHKKVSEIVVYINNNYMSNLTLESVSKNFYISPFYFTRIFKKVTGFTFIEYLNNIRTKEAMRLLRETKLNIREVGEMVGFGSISHFGRIFKSITGDSPLKYRQKNK